MPGQDEHSAPFASPITAPAEVTPPKLEEAAASTPLTSSTPWPAAPEPTLSPPAESWPAEVQPETVPPAPARSPVSAAGEDVRRDSAVRRRPKRAARASPRRTARARKKPKPKARVRARAKPKAKQAARSR